MPATTTAAPPVFPADVTAFAVEHGVAEVLPAVLAMTRRVFPTAPITTQIEEDAEIEDMRYILMKVDAAEMSVEQTVEAQHRWSGELFVYCPATHAHLFCLGTV